MFRFKYFFNLDLFEHPVKEFHLSLGVFAGQELAEGGAGLKKNSYFVDFFCINNILDLDAHYLKSAQQKRPAWAVRTFTFILSSLCLTVRKASLSLKWDGVLMRRGARDETFDGLLGSRLCRANLCPQAYEQ